MQASVFPLRANGVRLPRPGKPVDGCLQLAPAPTVAHPGALQARLTASEEPGATTLLPALHYATVQRITSNGIVIAGLELIARGHHSKANVARHRQTWWVMVHTLSAAEGAGLGELWESEVLEPAAAQSRLAR